MNYKMVSEARSSNGRKYTKDVINDAVRWLTSKTLPRGLNELQTKRFVKRWQDFTVKDGDLYLGTKLVVALEDVESVLKTMFQDDAIRVLSRDKLYEKVKERYIGITRKATFNFLKRTETYQLHKPFRRIPVVQPILTSRINQRWQADLIDVQRWAPSNHGTTFLLTTIDLFSKFARVVPLRNKEGATVASAIRQLFDKDKPSVLQTDNGSEFTNDAFAAVCSEFGVKQVFSLSYKPTSQGAIERFNGILERLIFSYMTEHRTKKYISALPTLVKNYNTTTHGVTKLTPEYLVDGATSEEQAEVKRNIHDQAKRLLDNKMRFPKLQKGDKVRLALTAFSDVRKDLKFRKKGLPQWTEEIYTVWTVSRPGKKTGLEKYTIKASDGVMYEGYLSRDQLQRIDEDALIKRAVVYRRRQQKAQEPTAVPLEQERPQRIRRPSRRLLESLQQ